MFGPMNVAPVLRLQEAAAGSDGSLDAAVARLLEVSTCHAERREASAVSIEDKQSRSFAPLRMTAKGSG